MAGLVSCSRRLEGHSVAFVAKPALELDHSAQAVHSGYHPNSGG
jgi:hypothetical protein